MISAPSGCRVLSVRCQGCRARLSDDPRHNRALQSRGCAGGLPYPKMNGGVHPPDGTYRTSQGEIVTDPNTPDPNTAYVPPAPVADPVAEAEAALAAAQATLDKAKADAVDAVTATETDVKTGVSAVSADVKAAAKDAFAELIKVSHFATESKIGVVTTAIHALIDAL